MTDTAFHSKYKYTSFIILAYLVFFLTNVLVDPIFAEYCAAAFRFRKTVLFQTFFKAEISLQSI